MKKKESDYNTLIISNPIRAESLIDEIRSIRSQLKNLKSSCNEKEKNAERICLAYKDDVNNKIIAEKAVKSKVDSSITKQQMAKDSLKAVAEARKNKAIDDIFGQLEILSYVQKSNTMWWASKLILLLFFILETAPLFVKILAPRGSYDSLLQLKEQKIIFESGVELYELEHDTKRRFKVLEVNEEELTQVEHEMNKVVMEKARNAQNEVASGIIEEWKKNELEKLRNDPAEYLKNTTNQ